MVSPQPQFPNEGPQGADSFVTLIHREDNLTDLPYQLTDAGYSPGINFEAGRITPLKLEFNKLFFFDRGPAADKVSH